MLTSLIRFHTCWPPSNRALDVPKPGIGVLHIGILEATHFAFDVKAMFVPHQVRILYDVTVMEYGRFQGQMQAERQVLRFWFEYT